jgi:hypothetical protein
MDTIPDRSLSYSERYESALADDVIRSDQIRLISTYKHYEEGERGIDDGRNGRAFQPYLILLSFFFIFSSLGIYLIGKGIDADFDVFQIGALGSFCLLGSRP